MPASAVLAFHKYPLLHSRRRVASAALTFHNCPLLHLRRKAASEVVTREIAAPNPTRSS